MLKWLRKKVIGIYIYKAVCPCVFRHHFFILLIQCVEWSWGQEGGLKGTLSTPSPVWLPPPPLQYLPHPPLCMFPHFEISMALSQILMHLIIKFYSVCLSVIKIQIFQSLFPSEARNHVSEARMPPQGLEFLNSSILVF